MARFICLVVLAVAMLAGMGCNRVAPLAKAIPYVDDTINGAGKTVTRRPPPGVSEAAQIGVEYGMPGGSSRNDRNR
ncbi:unnamed protein product [Tuwongella immobilis]|uniref:Lipoprotein n=2 Tax=Tuwongella immobilis TaxID=692036 RepID=A0A6C2YS94_9BACT|nr:unnamed protein product [Tuwongella immobilis]VTS05798.1 unnamed protein product [Tuwongella immobilis]